MSLRSADFAAVVLDPYLCSAVIGQAVDALARPICCILDCCT